MLRERENVMVKITNMKIVQRLKIKYKSKPLMDNFLKDFALRTIP